MKNVFWNFLSSVLLGAFGAIPVTFIFSMVLIAYSNAGSPHCNGCDPEWTPKMTDNEFWHITKYFLSIAWIIISVAIMFLGSSQSPFADVVDSEKQ